MTAKGEKNELDGTIAKYGFIKFPTTVAPKVTGGLASLKTEKHGITGSTHGLPEFSFEFTTNNQIPYNLGYFELTLPSD